ncbi:MAG: peptide methionine sulfoxide reductase [Saprospiraceae bacterium]|nr:peptide methionine sulfoxide reductase [Saprospiraceae bacterium]
MGNNHFASLLKKVPDGFKKVHYNGRTYSLTRTNFNNGKSAKVFARELGGSDWVSFNSYDTRNGIQLKPCEMPLEKVIQFLEHMEFLPEPPV